MSTIAQTILAQLGGNRFIIMTGARNFTTTVDQLIFSLPGSGGFTKQGINKVRITLTPMDLYRVEFARLRAGKLKIISVHDDVYAEDLPELFRQVTGLETRMPRIVGV